MINRLGLWLSAIALLGACVSVLPEPEAPSGLYTVAATEQAVGLPVDIVVREFEAPELMAGSAMVAEDEAGARRLVKSVEWSGRLTREMQMALVDSFDPSASGTALLPELGVPSRYRVIGRVQTLLLRGQSAECVATVSVTDTVERSLVGQRTVQASAMATRDGAHDRAQALKTSAEMCVRRIADATAEIVGTLHAGS